MKRRNQIPSDEARLINAAGDRPIDHLDDHTLDRHLENIFLFKLGLQNTFGIDLRQHTYTRPNHQGVTSAVLFNYLSEVPPLIEKRVDQLPAPQQAAYAKLKDDAVVSFWEVYYRFQPLIHQYAHRFGLDVDDLGNVLGRAILLYDKRRGFKFYSYLIKTLRESVKNLRGRIYAEQFHLPLSAGRLMPQLMWILDQETLRRGHRLSEDESEQVVLEFLRDQPARFSEATMRTICAAAKSPIRKISLSRDLDPSKRNGVRRQLPVPTRYSSEMETTEEYEHTLRRIHDAIVRAEFSCRDQAMLLERLDLAYDEDLYARIEAELTAGALRNRKAQLLVRFMAALHCVDAPRFGRFLKAEPQAAKPVLMRAIDDVADAYGLTSEIAIGRLLNVMSLSKSVYRLTISERGRLQQYLRPKDASEQAKSISGPLFHKLKAALIDQDRQGFPCLRSD